MSHTPIYGPGNPHPLSTMMGEIDELLRVVSLMGGYRYSP
jgi:hypothetical protein